MVSLRPRRSLVSSKSFISTAFKYSLMGVAGSFLSGGVAAPAWMGATGKAVTNWALKRVGMRNALRMMRWRRVAGVKAAKFVGRVAEKARWGIVGA